MGMKFFLILCFGVLLQDAFGNLAQRSYNPRFRNVNKKYLKSAPEDQFGATDEGFMEEMYLLDTKTNQLTKTDVILVSMPMETTFLEKEQVEQHPKPMKHSNKKKTHHQKLSQKPMSGEDSMVIHQVMPDNAAPIVLQLLGWSGNPPQPLVLPPMPTKNQVVMENPSVPIVIKEEIMEEMKPVSMIPMDQGIVKPSEIIVEEIMMNEEPLTLVKPIAEDKISNQAPEDKEKVTVVKNLEEVVTQADSLLEAISEAINEEKKPVTEMVQKEDKKAEKTEEVISAAIIPEISMEPKPMEDVKTQEIVEIMPVMVAAEKMPEPMTEASVPEKVSLEPKIEKIASEEMKIQSSEPESSMNKMEEVQKMEEVMETSVPEMKKEEEPKIEKIAAEEMKNQSSEPEMKKESSMEKMEEVQKMQEVIETAPAVLEVASVDLSMKKEPIVDTEMPSETKLMDNVMTADESHGTPQVAILPQNEEMKTSMEPKPMEADKKSEAPKPMMETMSKEAAIKAPIQKEIIKDLNMMIQPHSAAVPVAAESKISEDKKVPCDKLKKEAESSMTDAANKSESNPVKVEESLLEKKDVKPVQMDVMPVSTPSEKPKRKPKPSRKPRPSRRPRPSKKPSTTTESNESESESSSTTPKSSSSSTTTSSPSSTTPAARIVPDLGS